MDGALDLESATTGYELEAEARNYFDVSDLLGRDIGVSDFGLSARSATFASESEGTREHCADFVRRGSEVKLTCCAGFYSCVRSREVTEVF